MKIRLIQQKFHHDYNNTDEMIYEIQKLEDKWVLFEGKTFDNYFDAINAWAALREEKRPIDIILQMEI